MKRQRLSGIDGILDGLLSTEHAPAGPDPTTQPEPEDGEGLSDATKPDAAQVRGARRGRPLGRHCRKGGPKEKVTFRISCELASAYRDWSWESRCQLSELVEQALATYRDLRRR